MFVPSPETKIATRTMIAKVPVCPTLRCDMMFRVQSQLFVNQYHKETNTDYEKPLFTLHQFDSKSVINIF
jgi:hypothetical protein